jgi:hypothetical protein
MNRIPGLGLRLRAEVELGQEGQGLDESELGVKAYEFMEGMRLGGPLRVQVLALDPNNGNGCMGLKRNIFKNTMHNRLTYCEADWILQ